MHVPTVLVLETNTGRLGVRNRRAIAAHPDRDIEAHTSNGNGGYGRWRRTIAIMRDSWQTDRLRARA